MKFQTQLVVLWLLIFSLLFPCSWAADEAEFNITTQILTLPQVKVDSQYVYDVRLQLNSDGLFALLDFSSSPNSSAGDADEAEFNITTQILTLPQIKVDNQYVYDVRLQLNSDGLFALLDFSSSPNSSVGQGFTLDSVAISNGKLLEAYKCEKKDNNIENSIPLSWSNIPDGTNSLAIIMHHFPNPDDTSHPNSYLLLWDIAPTVTAIPYGEADDGPWYMGANKDGDAISYTSPCSHSSGTHEYTITIYALSETPASLPSNSSIDVTYSVLKTAIESVSVIDTATLIFNDETL